MSFIIYVAETQIIIDWSRELDYYFVLRSNGNPLIITAIYSPEKSLMTASNNNDLITIVTAFFDIGRGNLQSKEELPDYMTRTNDTYFEYFSNLATLDNPMVIFSDNEHIERIKNIRGNKPTTIIPFNIKKFEKTLKRIQEIQNNEEFTSKVRPDLLKNIEYCIPHMF